MKVVITQPRDRAPLMYKKVGARPIKSESFVIRNIAKGRMRNEKESRRNLTIEDRI